VQPPSADRRVHSAVSVQPLSLDRVIDGIRGDRVGGIAVFVGLVRDHDEGRQVLTLDYTAHPTAAGELARVTAEVANRHDILALATEHRIGHLRIGDTAVVVAAAAAHRAAAFAACRDLIDTLKLEVPIWKEQQFADGACEWVGLP
jgi:molybdopterin synthase catalytic subunit